MFLISRESTRWRGSVRGEGGSLGNAGACAFLLSGPIITGLKKVRERAGLSSVRGAADFDDSG